MVCFGLSRILGIGVNWLNSCREPYTVGGVDWKTHMKTVSYKDEIVEFKTVLSSIGKLQGWTLEEAQERFSNPLLDSLYFQ